MMHQPFDDPPDSIGALITTAHRRVRAVLAAFPVDPEADAAMADLMRRIAPPTRGRKLTRR